MDSSKTREQRISDVVAILDRQRNKIQQLFNEHYSGYDAAFEEHSAYASAQRWFDRTAKVIEENVGKGEAAKFKRAAHSAPRGRGGWRWREFCQFFDTHLIQLMDDIEENSEDSSFDALNSITAETTLVAVEKNHLPRDVFLSYSTSDKDEAREIENMLCKVGKHCFLAEKSLRPGDKFQDEIRDAIEGCNEVWILASPNSIRSAWVQREVSAAWALKKRIVPILLRCSPSDLPEILSELHAIDFHKVKSHIANVRGTSS